MKTQRIMRERGEWENLLIEQVKFIVESSRNYDRGNNSEAKRLAVILRVLCHDTPRSKSLLEQMGLKMRIAFVSGSFSDKPGNQESFFGLVAYAPGSRQFYVPSHLMLDDAEARTKRLAFGEWWNQVVIRIRSPQEVTFTRAELILNLADTDGGAHLDSTLEEKYMALSRLNLAGWKVVRNGKSYDVTRGPELASIRQVAHEIILTLEEMLPRIGCMGYLSARATDRSGAYVGDMQIFTGNSAGRPE